MNLTEMKFEVVKEDAEGRDRKSVEITSTSIIFSHERGSAFFEREDLDWIANCLAKAKAMIAWSDEKSAEQGR